MNDIASFRPSVGNDHMEPNGWTVVRLHTNFYSDARPHVVDGTLLGAPASVRFTPRSWTWDYGDGSTRSSATPGASWAALGTREFEPTATSHAYAEPVSATIRLTIGFGAEYRISAGGWTPIDGILDVAAPPLAITARDAATVLVGADCGVNPAGPGC
jgi:PKD repeat protein